MAKIDLDLDDLTNAALKRLVKQLLVADDAEEKKLMSQLAKKLGPHNAKEEKAEKNDLADLHEEMHGKPRTPMVEDDDLEEGEELPAIPRKMKRKS